MGNENALTVVTRPTWETITAIAPAMHQARLFGVNSADQAAAIMLTGYEVGFGLTAAFEFIHIVKGKPSISPRGMMALIHRSGELKSFDLTEIQKNGKFHGYSCRMERKNGFAFSDSFTLDDAHNADLLKDDSGWMKYPKNMCRWRVVGFVADVVFPDLLGGLKRADEYGATVDDRGDVIISAPVTAPIAFDSAAFISALITEHGAEAIVAATDGDIPTDEKALLQLAARLQKQVVEAEWSDVAAELGGVADAIEDELETMVDEIVGSVEGVVEQ